MKITKLVVLFNYQKILIGLFVSILFFVFSLLLNSTILGLIFKIISLIIFLNIIASIIASYILYDKSDLYELQKINKVVNIAKDNKAILIHASFDPLSKKIENEYPNLNLTVCDIYGNRHEHDKGIKTSKKIFPPNPKEIKIHPNKLPFENESQDFILAITAVHEILNHETRVEFFKEAKRILKDDGIIIVSEQFRNFTNFLFFNIGAFHFLSFKQWKKGIYDANLKIDGSEKITPFANMLIIKKNIA
ncbi:MAG TPA: methyltransferase domain-containing protein [Saprospiraceae bacterium]|nr:methyltransferase domain-containing protein [Saprospiraceae bacterium]